MAHFVEMLISMDEIISARKKLLRCDPLRIASSDLISMSMGAFQYARSCRHTNDGAIQHRK